MSVPSFDPSVVPQEAAPAAPAPAPEMPSGSLGMADLAMLEAYSQGLEQPAQDPALEGQLEGAPEAPPVDEVLQDQTPEEVLRLQQQLEQESRQREALQNKLGKYETVESQQLQEQFKNNLIEAFSTAPPEEIAESFIDLSRKVRQLQDQQKGGVAEAKAQGRFIGLLEATEAHDPTFSKKLEAMEKTFGFEATQAIVFAAQRQQDPIGFIKERLKNISLPEEVEAAKAEAAKQAAQNLIAKGKAPEVAPNTGSMRGKSPAPALDVNDLVQKNLGMVPMAELDALSAALDK